MRPEQGPSEKDRNFKVPETSKGRFASLEMTPPGMEGKDLEKWKAEQLKKDQETKELASEKRKEEIYEENHGPKSSF